MAHSGLYRNHTLLWLTTLVVALSLTASLGGLLINELYNDSDTIKRAWFSNDIVTIIIAPMLVLSLSLQRRGDQRGLVLWLGLMLYMFYNYAFYLFGASFNEFFLIYVALYSLSLYSIVIGLLSVNVQAIHENSRNLKRKKVISIFLFLLAIPISIVEIKQCITFIFSGEAPQVPTLIFALDLSTVIPTTILASILLWKNYPWGNILGMMMLIKSFAYGLVLVTGTILITASGIAPYDNLFPFYIFLVVGGLVFGIMHFRDLRTSHSIITRKTLMTQHHTNVKRDEVNSPR